MAMLPYRTDDLKSYFKRIIGIKVAGVKWSLPLILEQYGLIAKHNVSPEQMHSAGFDSLCLHWIMEEFRAQTQSELKPKMATRLGLQRTATRRQRLI